jgi:hypothetical protein
VGEAKKQKPPDAHCKGRVHQWDGFAIRTLSPDLAPHNYGSGPRVFLSGHGLTCVVKAEPESAIARPMIHSNSVGAVSYYAALIG